MISFITILIVWVLYISFWVPRVVSALEFHDIKGSFCQKILLLKPHILVMGCHIARFGWRSLKTT